MHSQNATDRVQKNKLFKLNKGNKLEIMKRWEKYSYFVFCPSTSASLLFFESLRNIGQQINEHRGIWATLGIVKKNTPTLA